MRIAFVDDISFDSERRYMRGLVSGFLQIRSRDTITIYSRKDRAPETIPGVVVKRTWSKLAFPFQITRNVVRDRQDIIHVEFDTPTFDIVYTPIFLPLLFLFLRVARKCATVTIHAVPPISNQGEMKTMNELLKLRSLNIPPPFLRIALMLGYGLVGVLSQGIVVHTKILKDWLTSMYGIPDSKVVVIPHGVEISPSDGKPPLSMEAEDRKIILFFGRVNPRKGIESLLRAWSRISPSYPDFVLVIAGTIYRYDAGGIYFSGLKHLSAKLGISKSVIFTGRISEAEIDWFFANCEFVVLPYTFSNAASGPLAIAIGYGRPVIACSIGTFNDEIIDNVNGILVEPDNDAELQAAIYSMLSNKELGVRLAQNARKMILKHSWQHHSDMLESLWHEKFSNPFS